MRCVSQNLLVGGIGEEDRWSSLARIIGGTVPDILLLQEIHGWSSYEHRQIYRAEADLGLRVAGWVPPARTLGGTLVMYRPQAMRLMAWEDRYSRELTNGLGVAVFDVDGVTVAAASVHLTSMATSIAVGEASHAAHRALRHTPLAIVGGDFNSLPPSDGLDPAGEDPLCLASRWTGPVDAPVADHDVSHVMERGSFTDVAQHIADTTGNPEALRPTVDDGARLDRFYVSGPLVSAVSDYRVIPHSASDHYAVVTDIDMANALTT